VRADLAYAESVELIKYLAHLEGVEGVQALIARMARDTPFPIAFREVFGRSVREVGAAFAAEYEGPVPWIQAFGVDSAFWWGSGGIVLLFAYGIVKRRNRKKLARWARQEEAEDRLYAAIEQGLGPPKDYLH
jgi:hypothetical protein